MPRPKGLPIGSQIVDGGTGDARPLLTKEELAHRLSLPSTRMVDELMKRHKIPYVKLGHRTVRFNWERVKAALEKMEIKEVR